MVYETYDCVGYKDSNQKIATLQIHHKVGQVPSLQFHCCLTTLKTTKNSIKIYRTEKEVQRNEVKFYFLLLNLVYH